MNRNPMMRLGMICLLLGNILHFLVHPTTALGENLADGTFGLLVGASICANLLSLRSRRCTRSVA